jgi:hypothetical protein
MKIDVVDFAYQVINMQNELYELSMEVERLKEIELKYKLLLQESYDHSTQMTNNLFGMLLDKTLVVNKNAPGN